MLLFLIAITFHKSSIVFLMFLISKQYAYKEYSIKQIILLLFIIPIPVLFFSSNIINLIESNTDSLYLHTSVGGIGMIAFLTFCVLAGIMIWSTFQKTGVQEKRLISSLFMIYCADIVFLISRYNLAVMRLYYYYFLLIFLYNIGRKNFHNYYKKQHPK